MKEHFFRFFEQPWLVAVGSITGVIGTLVGIQLVLAILIGMMVIDVVVGMAVAWQHGEINSKKSFQGGIRKFIVLCVVLASWLIQYAIAVFAAVQISPYLPDVPKNVPLGEFVGSYFIIYFFFSILENAVRGGVRLPEQLTNALKITSMPTKPTHDETEP